MGVPWWRNACEVARPCLCRADGPVARRVTRGAWPRVLRPDARRRPEPPSPDDERNSGTLLGAANETPVCEPGKSKRQVTRRLRAGWEGLFVARPEVAPLRWGSNRAARGVEEAREADLSSPSFRGHFGPRPGGCWWSGFSLLVTGSASLGRLRMRGPFPYPARSAKSESMVCLVSVCGCVSLRSCQRSTSESLA
jgi:hypothetical protein